MVSDVAAGVPVDTCVRPSDYRAQQFSDGVGRKFTPLDANGAFVLARDIGLENRQIIHRPERQDDGNLDA